MRPDGIGWGFKRNPPYIYIIDNRNISYSDIFSTGGATNSRALKAEERRRMLVCRTCWGDFSDLLHNNQSLQRHKYQINLVTGNWVKHVNNLTFWLHVLRGIWAGRRIKAWNWCRIQQTLSTQTGLQIQLNKKAQICNISLCSRCMHFFYSLLISNIIDRSSQRGRI